MSKNNHPEFVTQHTAHTFILNSMVKKIAGGNNFNNQLNSKQYISEESVILQIQVDKNEKKAISISHQ